MNKLFSIMTLLLLAFSCASFADKLPNVRVGVLKYGTLNWEMDVIEQQQLAAQNGISLDVVPLTSPQALLVALQGDAVDIVIGDWLWVARQTEMDRHFYFYPYSKAAGVLVTRPDAKITTLGDLRGKTIGIAGGKGNKNWVLYHTYIERQTGLDLATDTTLKFAAPPMLNALMQQGKLDAVINFWHYGAELNAHGMPSLLTMDDVLKGLDISSDVPLLGWLFRQSWADANSDIVERFLATSYAARQQMQSSNYLWTQIPSFTEKFDPKVQGLLRDAYRAGIPSHFNQQDIGQLNALFTLLKTHEENRQLTGNLAALPNAIFWQSGVLP